MEVFFKIVLTFGLGILACFALVFAVVQWLDRSWMLKTLSKLREEVDTLRHERAQCGKRAMILENNLAQTEKMRYENWEKLKASERAYKALLCDVRSACGCTDGDDIRNQLEEYL